MDTHAACKNAVSWIKSRFLSQSSKNLFASVNYAHSAYITSKISKDDDVRVHKTAGEDKKSIVVNDERSQLHSTKRRRKHRK